MLIAILFARLSPYHHARLQAVSQKLKLIAIEYSNIDRTYAWKPVTVSSPFSQITLFKDTAYQDQTPGIKQQVIQHNGPDTFPDKR